ERRRVDRAQPLPRLAGAGGAARPVREDAARRRRRAALRADVDGRRRLLDGRAPAVPRTRAEPRPGALRPRPRAGRAPRQLQGATAAVRDARGRLRAFHGFSTPPRAEAAPLVST